MFGWFRKRADSKGPDFSAVDTAEKAAELCRRGDLERIFLVPLDFGGADDERNMLYVPVGVGQVKAQIENETIRAMAREGKVSSFEASVEYEGASVIPISITVVASDPGRFTSTINVWGKALGHDTNA